MVIVEKIPSSVTESLPTACSHVLQSRGHKKRKNISQTPLVKVLGELGYDVFNDLGSPIVGLPFLLSGFIQKH